MKGFKPTTKLLFKFSTGINLENITSELTAVDALVGWIEFTALQPDRLINKTIDIIKTNSLFFMVHL